MNERGSGFARRFGAYFLGIAIGLLFLGFYQTQRARMKAQQQAEKQAETASEQESDEVTVDDEQEKPTGESG